MRATSPAPQRRDIGILVPIAAVTTAFVTYCLVILGSTVRVTQSGMGCPGWPLCYGQVGPIDSFHSVIEQSHRYVVALVTVLILITAGLVWRYARERRAIWISSLAAVGVLIIQIILGAITVLTHNAPYTVALHLMGGLTLLATVSMTATTSLLAPSAKPGGRVAPIGWAAICSTFLLLISGSLVVDGGATYSCSFWPVCGVNGNPIQLVAIQYIHRFMVLLTVILIGIFVMRAVKQWKGVPAVRPLAWALTLILAVQIAVGGLVATLSAPEALQDLHLALAGLIWVGVVIMATIGWQEAAEREDRTPAVRSEGAILGGPARQPDSGG